MNKIAFLETSDWEREYLKKFPRFITLTDLYEEDLNLENVAKFKDYEIISCFINSQLSKEVLEKLPNLKFIATRSTGFDHLDLNVCKAK